jgi:hypothetical protein
MKKYALLQVTRFPPDLFIVVPIVGPADKLREVVGKYVLAQDSLELCCVRSCGIAEPRSETFAVQVDK